MNEEHEEDEEDLGFFQLRGGGMYGGMHVMSAHFVPEISGHTRNATLTNEDTVNTHCFPSTHWY